MRETLGIWGLGGRMIGFLRGAVVVARSCILSAVVVGADTLSLSVAHGSLSVALSDIGGIWRRLGA